MGPTDQLSFPFFSFFLSLILSLILFLPPPAYVLPTGSCSAPKPLPAVPVPTCLDRTGPKSRRPLPATSHADTALAASHGDGELLPTSRVGQAGFDLAPSWRISAGSRRPQGGPQLGSSTQRR